MKRAQSSFDLVVFGATPGGIAAACVAAEEGVSVCLLDPSRFVGGHLSAGICTTETEHMLSVSFSGWMMTFLRRIGAHYGLDGPLHRCEPHVAERAFEELLDEAGVTVRREFDLETVETEGGRIRAASALDGARVEGRMFIDASYEGDLMARAGVPYAVGRESMEDYGESLAGIRFIDSLDEVWNTKGHAHRIDEVWEMDLRTKEGGWIDGITRVDDLTPGAGDGKVMNYHYRITVTRSADRIPFARPEGYDEARFELLARWFRVNRGAGLWDVLGRIDNPTGRYRVVSDSWTEVAPGDKIEVNNHQASILSLGHLGGQFRYPEGDRAVRAEVIRDHRAHNQGLLYYLCHGEDVPSAVRKEANGLGLPPDEYPEDGHWPYQPYIRETRRMRGAYVLRQRDVLEEREKPDGIFWNSHWIDCHHVQRVALDDRHFRNEGRIWRELTEPYLIPYRGLTPRGEDCVNLLVPGCVSATHVAYCSVRLESTWMGLGEAAGVAAARALAEGRAVQEIDTDALRERLRRRGLCL